MTDPIVYLGYANGWNNGTPEQVRTCQEERALGIPHKFSSRQLGRSLTEVVCTTCGYSYKVDSGD